MSKNKPQSTPPFAKPALSLAQQQEQKLVQEFLADYKKLVEKYGYDFSAPIQLVKIQPNVNPIVKPNTTSKPIK